MSGFRRSSAARAGLSIKPVSARLSGGEGTLHIDPESAKFGGFDEPIPHSECAFGPFRRLLLVALYGNDGNRFRKIKVHFSSPVFPGEPLTIPAWNDGSRGVPLEARAGERIVVSNAYFEFA